METACDIIRYANAVSRVSAVVNPVGLPMTQNKGRIRFTKRPQAVDIRLYESVYGGRSHASIREQSAGHA